LLVQEALLHSGGEAGPFSLCVILRAAIRKSALRNGRDTVEPEKTDDVQAAKRS